MKTLLAFACLLVATGLYLVADQRPALAEGGTCWLVYYVSSGPPDSADEVICLTSPTEGYIRETSIFGDANGCNRVTVNRSGEAMDFIVDYSKCDNNAPSHSISCPSTPNDRLNCVWRMLDNSAAPSDAYLEPEK